MAMNPRGETRIFRAKRDKDYTTVANASAKDKALSWEALGVLFYILTKPDDWEVKAEQLTGFRAGGRDRMQRILKELRGAGYMRLAYERDGNGHILDSFYEVADTPEWADPDRKPENPTIGDSGNTESLKSRKTAEPITGKPGRILSTEDGLLSTDHELRTETDSDANASGAGTKNVPVATPPHAHTNGSTQPEPLASPGLPSVAVNGASPAGAGDHLEDAPQPAQPKRRSARNGSTPAEPDGEPSRGAESKAVFGELCEWLGLDWTRLPANTRGRLNKTAGNILDAGLGLDAVEAARLAWSDDWRAKGGRAPELGLVEDLVARAAANGTRPRIDMSEVF